MNAMIPLALAVSAAAAPPPRTPLSFAFDLYRQVAAANPGKNVFLSPASARWALGIAYAGAAGRTQEAMANTLGALPPAENMKAESARIASLMSADPKVKLRVANAIWLKRGFPFHKDFVSAVTAAYRADVFERDFEPTDAQEANAWVSKKTEGKIPTILDKFKADDRAVLINAVYFKGTWTDQFEAWMTTDEDFHIASGKTVKRKLMDRRGEYPDYKGPGFQAVRLPYGSKRLGMIVLLPVPGAPLKTLDAVAADAAAWPTILAGMRQREGRVRIPRFKLEFIAPLNDPLTAMGMGIAFDRMRADFTGMADARKPDDRLFISSVLQKTFVEVNEEGTEAAAATAVHFAALGSAPRLDFDFIADRPFLYAIEDHETGEIIFLGALHDPR